MGWIYSKLWSKYLPFRACLWAFLSAFSWRFCLVGLSVYSYPGLEGPCWWWFVCFLFVYETRQRTTAICIPICNSGKWKKQLIDLGSTWWLIILLEVNWTHNVLIPTIFWRIELLWRLQTITPRFVDKYWFDGLWSKERSVFLNQLFPVCLMRTILCLILTFRGGDEGNSSYWQKDTVCEIEIF